MTDATSFRRRATAGCLAAAGALVLAGVLVSPTHDADRGAQLAAYAADPGGTQAAALLLHLGYLLLVPGAFGLLALLRRRAIALGHLAGALAVVGAVSLSGNVVLDLYDLALAQTLTAGEALRVTEAAQALPVAGAFIVPSFLGTALGFVLLGVALRRAGWLGTAPVVLLAAGWIGFFASSVVGAVLLSAALGLLAARVAGTSDEAWRRGEPASATAAATAAIAGHPASPVA